MSLVGLSALICIVRLGFAGYCEGYGNLPAGEPKKDWSYGYDCLSEFPPLCILFKNSGHLIASILCLTNVLFIIRAIVIWALLQAEVAVYIIAQVIPLLRVMVLGEGSKASVRPEAVEKTSRARGLDKGKTAAVGLGSITEVGVELVQLPGGKIVPADSEEARAEFGTSQAPGTGEVASPEVAASAPPPPQEGGYRGPELDDEVHKKWSDMGLSRRAWSKTPSPPTVPARLAST